MKHCPITILGATVCFCLICVYVDARHHYAEKKCTNHKLKCQEEFACSIRLKTIAMSCEPPEFFENREKVPAYVCTDSCMAEIEKLRSFHHGSQMLKLAVEYQATDCFFTNHRIKSCYQNSLSPQDTPTTRSCESAVSFCADNDECAAKILPQFLACASFSVEVDDSSFCRNSCGKIIRKIIKMAIGGVSYAERLRSCSCLNYFDYPGCVSFMEMEERFRTRCKHPARYSGRYDKGLINEVELLNRFLAEDENDTPSGNQDAQKFQKSDSEFRGASLSIATVSFVTVFRLVVFCAQI